MSLTEKLTTALAKQNIQVTDSQLNQLNAYLELLSKWNQAYNLTAISSIEQMIPYHILDSLSVLPFLHGKVCLDVGTGAGLPGIPLAIMQPISQFYLLDSNGKKTRFLQQVKFELELDNIHIINSRIKAYQPDIEFSTIVSRAFASLNDFVQATIHLQNAQTVLLAMKGEKAAQEIKLLKATNFDIGQNKVKIHGIDGERCILSLKNPG